MYDRRNFVATGHENFFLTPCRIPPGSNVIGSAGHHALPPQAKETTMGNPFVHVELNTTDIAKAKAFYGKLFDWQLEDFPAGPFPYNKITVGSASRGGE